MNVKVLVMILDATTDIGPILAAVPDGVCQLGITDDDPHRAAATLADWARQKQPATKAP